MNIKPILFSTPMVQAILAGRKTMTRRVVNKDISNQFDLEADGKTIVAYIDQETGDSHQPEEVCRIKKGDILWVRETWRIGAWDYDRMAICVDYKAMGLLASTEWVHIDDHDQMDKYIVQSRAEAKASGLQFDDYGEYHWKYGCSPCRWRPSIFLPKAAARIWLRVTDVRCERVNQITGEDAAREGVAKSQEEMDDDLCNYCPLPDGSKGVHCYGGNPVMCEGRHCNEAYQTYLADIAVDDFATLWDHLNAKRGFPWDSNPYVWVVSFERCEKPESEV